MFGVLSLFVVCYYVYVSNATSIVTITNDAKGIKMRLLGNV